MGRFALNGLTRSLLACISIACTASSVSADIVNTLVVDTNAPKNGGGIVLYQNYDDGQSFTVPSDGHNILTSFSYWVFGSGGSPTYHTAIYPFDPSTRTVTGLALFTSGATVCPFQLPPTPQTFNTALSLTPGGHCLATVHIDNTVNNNGVAFSIAFPLQDSYPNGAFLVSFGAEPYPAVTWDDAVPSSPGGDVAFAASFATPEPAGCLLLFPTLLLLRRSR
jgi:hypothetical protein